MLRTIANAKRGAFHYFTSRLHWMLNYLRHDRMHDDAARCSSLRRIAVLTDLK
jgi:hypothetical protein